MIIHDARKPLQCLMIVKFHPAWWNSNVAVLLASLLLDPNLKTPSFCGRCAHELLAVNQLHSRKTLGNLCDPEGHVGTCHWGSKNKNLEHAWGLEEFTIMKVCWFLFALKVNNTSILCNQKSNGSLLTQSQLWKHWQEILGASRSPHWMQDTRRKCLKCGRISWGICL